MNEDFMHSDESLGMGQGVSKATLVAILDASMDCIFLIEPSGSILFANKALANRLGTPAEKLININVNSFSPPAVAAIMQQCIQKVIANGRPCRSVDKIRHIGFESIYYPIFDNNRSVVQIAIFSKDTIQRKHTALSPQPGAQHKREENNSKIMELVLDTIPSRLFWKDVNGFFLGCNRLFAQDAGMTNPEDIIGTDDFDMVWREQAEMYRSDDAEVMRTGIPKLNYEEPQTTPNGRRIWISTSKVPLRDENGNIIGVLGAYENITSRKQYEEQLRVANEELERRVEQRTYELQETQKKYLHAEKLTAIGKLSASIAHEFNNPLQAIHSILQGIKKRALMAEEDRQLLDAAIGESNRLKILIRSLQDFNRPSPGKREFMDLHASLDSLLLIHKSEFHKKHISVQLDYGENLPRILAIPDQIKQVFLNLLINAADACQRLGGRITVITRQEKEYVSVAIKDTGIGIPPENLDLIFQPFFTTKAEVKGIGLGLPVSHGIINNHGGEIRVESCPGKGATFTVVLPIAGKSKTNFKGGETV